MGNIREVGLGVQDSREEAERRRREESGRHDRQILMNKWAFHTACVKRSESYNCAEAIEGTVNGDESVDGRK